MFGATYFPYSQDVEQQLAGLFLTHQKKIVLVHLLKYGNVEFGARPEAPPTPAIVAAIDQIAQFGVCWYGMKTRNCCMAFWC
jgi:hypothetical protein